MRHAQLLLMLEVPLPHPRALLQTTVAAVCDLALQMLAVLPAWLLLAQQEALLPATPQAAAAARHACHLQQHAAMSPLHQQQQHPLQLISAQQHDLVRLWLVVLLAVQEEPVLGVPQPCHASQ